MADRHRATVRGAAVVALGTLALTAIQPAASAGPGRGPAPSAAQTLGADKPSPQVLHALERDLRLTPDQAATRLVNEADAGTRAGVLRNTLGTRFAGAWVKGATAAELTVATTDRADFSAIRAQGATPVAVRWGLAGLRSVKEKLDRAAEAPASPSVKAGEEHLEPLAHRDFFNVEEPAAEAAEPATQPSLTLFDVVHRRYAMLAKRNRLK